MDNVHHITKKTERASQHEYDDGCESTSLIPSPPRSTDTIAAKERKAPRRVPLYIRSNHLAHDNLLVMNIIWNFQISRWFRQPIPIESHWRVNNVGTITVFNRFSVVFPKSPEYIFGTGKDDLPKVTTKRNLWCLKGQYVYFVRILLPEKTFTDKKITSQQIQSRLTQNRKGNCEVILFRCKSQGFLYVGICAWIIWKLQHILCLGRQRTSNGILTLVPT